MNSKEIMDKFLARNKYVLDCGLIHNNSYSEYLETCLSYDNLKQAFYIAVRLSKHDLDFAEDQLERYEHLVKHFDKQLLNHLKERNYDVQGIKFNDDENDQFRDRITKIEAEGLSRNRKYHMFIDEKNEFNGAISMLYNEISLAFRDGLITNIDYKIRCESMKYLEKDFEERLKIIRENFNKKRVKNRNFAEDDPLRQSNGNSNESYGRGRGSSRRDWHSYRYDWSSNGRGRGRNGRGRGRNGRGRGSNGRGRGSNGRINEPY